ncbi:SRPBCC family protein [Arthrobacter sp.]|uniref:SRPBCC family protein n=1 Tax=Arthrobacter sp. TaxID=1667 RepID=UPI0025870627|nr:SRPBCC family protein [Arthrobacter sp.]
MNVDITVRTLISRPVAVVAEYAADPLNAPKWYANIKAVTLHTPETPLAVGAQMDFVAHFLGRRLSYTYEITEYDPGRRLVMRTSDGPFPMCTTYSWSAEGDATVMALQNTGTPSGFGALMTPFMSLAMKAATTKDLARLKRILEQR